MEVFFTDLTTIFNDMYVKTLADAVWAQIAMQIPSTTATETHGWLNDIPGLREWIGPRVANGVESKKLTVTNKKFEGTIEMKREDIEDDKLGLYRTIQAPGLGMEAAIYPEELILGALLYGTTSKWVDDTEFFSDARTIGSSGTIDNYGTTALSAATFNTAYKTMAGWKSNQGKPLHVRPRYLLHGPAQRTKAFEICQDDFAARTADASTIVQGGNPNKGKVIPIETPYLVDGITLPTVGGATASYDAEDYWFLLGEKAALRGMCWQLRMGPEVQTSRTDNNSDYVFENDCYQFGVRMRGAAFLTMPQLIHGNFVA